MAVFCRHCSLKFPLFASLRPLRSFSSAHSSRAGTQERCWIPHRVCSLALQRQRPAAGRQQACSTLCSAAATEEAVTTTSDPHTPSERPAFRAQLDWKAIKSDLAAVKQNVANRNSSADPDLVVHLYDDWRALHSEVEDLRTERNSNAKAMKGKLDQERRQALIAEGKELKDRLAVFEQQLDTLEDSLQREGQKLPNFTHPEVPVGGEEAARTLREVGSRPSFSFPTKDHLQLGTALDLIDFDTAAAVSGTKFVYLRRAAALLEMALCNYAMQRVASKGYVPLMTPDLVRASVLEKCGFQPRAENTQVYSVEDSPLCLTGTAEVPLAAVCMDKVLSEEELPLKMAAFGHCFRTEAGAGGSASKGLYRVHQFSKVEMFVVCTPAQSEALLEELCALEEEMFTELGLHFKVLDMPTGDLGAPAYRKLDIEAWMPGLERYGEISSASNCTDYQSRRLNIRYRPAAKEEDSADKKGKSKKPPTEFAHTLNATACAVPRMIVAILENFQREDGTIEIPVALRPYMAGMTVIEPPKP